LHEHDAEGDAYRKADGSWRAAQTLLAGFFLLWGVALAVLTAMEVFVGFALVASAFLGPLPTCVAAILLSGSGAWLALALSQEWGYEIVEAPAPARA
jgi:hypothetical protein